MCPDVRYIRYIDFSSFCLSSWKFLLSLMQNVVLLRQERKKVSKSGKKWIPKMCFLWRFSDDLKTLKAEWNNSFIRSRISVLMHSQLFKNRFSQCVNSFCNGISPARTCPLRSVAQCTPIFECDISSQLRRNTRRKFLGLSWSRRTRSLSKVKNELSPT